MRLPPSQTSLARLSLVLLVLLLAFSSALAADHWPSFRGPTDQGLSDAVGLPVQWSETENIVWKTAIAGKAWSSPVIWGSRIWLTSAPDDGTQLYVVCVDKDTGKQLLRKRVRNVVAPQYCHPFNSYASPSPVVEEGRVYVSFGAPYNGCLDTESGDVLWERTDFTCNHFRGAGSSPLLYKELLILHFDGSDRQYIVAMNKHNGQTVWQTDRSVDFGDLDPQTRQPTREGDMRKAFSTPIIVDVRGKPVLISLSSMALYGYDPDNGEELWRVESIGTHSGSPRPVAGHGLVFSPMGVGGDLWAIRPDGHGVVTDTHVVWRYSRVVPRRSSILLVDDLLFMSDDNGVAACVDARTGEEVWRERLGGNYSASPIAAAGRVYFFDQEGKTTVVEASRRYHVLAVNQLEDGFMGSPAVSGDALFLRTRTHLYRIEQPAAP